MKDIFNYSYINHTTWSYISISTSIFNSLAITFNILYGYMLQTAEWNSDKVVFIKADMFVIVNDDAKAASSFFDEIPYAA